jgi:hypothetical protein
MIKDNLKIKGQLVIEKTTAAGEVERTEVNNLVVDDGIEYILSCVVNDSNNDGTGDRPAVMSHMAVGTDGTAQVSTDSALGAEIVSGGRQGLVSTTLDSATNSMEFVCLFDAGEGTGAIEEAGIFNASSGGTMLARTTFPVINKEALDKLTITWVITLAVA